MDTSQKQLLHDFLMGNFDALERMAMQWGMDREDCQQILGELEVSARSPRAIGGEPEGGEACRCRQSLATRIGSVVDVSEDELRAIAPQIDLIVNLRRLGKLAKIVATEPQALV